MKESDLYSPLKTFLTGQGFEVKGEIGDCDVLAVRADEPPVVVELKLTLNLDVVLQAVDRLSLSPNVYLGVPRSCSPLKRRRKRVLKLVRMLGLGLIAIDPTSRAGSIDVLVDPGPYAPRKSKPRTQRLLGEFAKRVGDPNAGGMAKRKGVMTAYRQRAIAISEFLKVRGPTKAAEIASETGEPKARDILYRNVYGWFERESLGVYALSPRGEREAQEWVNLTKAQVKEDE